MSETDIKELSALLFVPKYARSFGRIGPDCDEIFVNGAAYSLLRLHIKSNSLWNVEAQMPIKEVPGILNPLGTVLGVTGIGKAVVGNVIDPPNDLIRCFRCIGSYYRHVESDSGNGLRVKWGSYEYRR